VRPDYIILAQLLFGNQPQIVGQRTFFHGVLVTVVAHAHRDHQ
jgi:hypothetical protein